MAALIARKQHGLGTVIEAPLLECGISAFAWSNLSGEKQEPKDSNFSPLDNPEEQREKLGAAAIEIRNLFGDVTGNFYCCADNRMIFLWVMSYPAMAKRKKINTWTMPPIDS